MTFKRVMSAQISNVALAMASMTASYALKQETTNWESTYSALDDVLAGLATRITASW